MDMKQIIDLSVTIDCRDVSPEKVTCQFLDHKQGARRLANSRLEDLGVRGIKKFLRKILNAKD